MKKQPRRQSVLVSMAVVLSAGIFGWTYLDFQNARQSAMEAGTSLTECEYLAKQIAVMQDFSKSINWLAPPDYRPGPTIEKALRDAAITMPNFSVSVSLGRSAPDSPFREASIDIPSLENVSLEQAVRFLYSISASNPSYQINQITLTPNLRPSSTNRTVPTWNVDIDQSFISTVDK